MGFILKTRVGCVTRNPRVLAALAQGFLRGVVASNRVTMQEAKRQGKRFPKLYQSGVRYEREPWAGEYEEFADCLTVLHRQWGDCDDLAAWRVAELQEAGEPADIHLYWRPREKTGGQLVMHVEVRRGSKCSRCGTMQQTGSPKQDLNSNPMAQCKHCNAIAVPWGRIEDPSRYLGL